MHPCKSKKRTRADYNRPRIAGAEISVLFYIARFQDNTGKIEGIYYKDIMEHTGYSRSQVYLALKNLEKLGYIKRSKSDYSDMDLIICDNDFSDKRFHRGYVKVNKKIFTSGKFFGFSGYFQIIFLEFLINSSSGHYKVKAEHFFQLYQERFGITKQTLRNYITKLRAFFHIYLKNGIYFIKQYKGKVSGTEAEQRADIEHTERKQLHRLQVKKALRRNKVEQVTHKLQEDLMTLLRQYSEADNKVPFDLNAIIRRTLEMMNNEKRILDRVINIKLVHKLIRQTVKGEAF